MRVIGRVDLKLGEIRRKLDEREQARVVGESWLGLKEVLKPADRLTQCEKGEIFYRFLV
jgi:hypothetical protein